MGEAWSPLAILLSGDAPDFVQLVRRGAQRQIAVRALSCKGSTQVRVALRVAQLCCAGDTPAFVPFTRRAAQLWLAKVAQRCFAGDAPAFVKFARRRARHDPALKKGGSRVHPRDVLGLAVFRDPVRVL